MQLARKPYRPVYLATMIAFALSMGIGTTGIGPRIQTLVGRVIPQG